MIDGAGIGSCMVANKVPGVRAALCYDHATAVNSREHNDANVLTLGAGLIGEALARQIVQTWLATDFGGRQARPTGGKNRRGRETVLEVRGTDMPVDMKTVETLVEIITREVLLAMADEEYRQNHPRPGVQAAVRRRRLRANLF